MAISVVYFDKSNKQKDFQYMAKDMSNRYVIGYIVVDKPWYSNENEWIYYIISNKYGQGFCGGASDLGVEKTIVDKNTIVPFNNINEIIYNLSIGMIVRLDKEFYRFDNDAPEDNTIVTIHNIKEIPLELWGDRNFLEYLNIDEVT